MELIPVSVIRKTMNALPHLENIFFNPVHSLKQMHGNTQAHIYTHLIKRSSSGLSSRLRGSTLSGNWLMALHNKLRKLVKSVRSSTLSACSNCSRNRTPTSPLLITSASGPSLDPDPSSSSLTSSTSSSC